MRASHPFCAVALVLAGACSRGPAGGGERGSGSVTSPTTGAGIGSAGASAPPAGPVASVTLAGSGGPQKVTVEVVRSPALLEKGLMYRRNLPPDHGMLFLMGEEDVHHFWMKNTLIPLDIVFIGRDLTVVGTIASAKPLDLSSRGVGKPSLYVLEVNGGWMAAHGVTDGAKVTFDNVDAAAR
jgi:hypothetical protein